MDNMIDKELFVVGCDDKKTGYRQIFHLGEYELTKKSYDALCNGANGAGLNKQYLFHIPYPPDDEVVEMFQLTNEFLRWLKSESDMVLQYQNAKKL